MPAISSTKPQVVGSQGSARTGPAAATRSRSQLDDPGGLPAKTGRKTAAPVAARQPLSLHDLPNEVLVEVFRHVAARKDPAPARDDIVSLMATRKQFKALIEADAMTRTDGPRRRLARSYSDRPASVPPVDEVIRRLALTHDPETISELRFDFALHDIRAGLDGRTAIARHRVSSEIHKSIVRKEAALNAVEHGVPPSDAMAAEQVVDPGHRLIIQGRAASTAVERGMDSDIAIAHYGLTARPDELPAARHERDAVRSNSDASDPADADADEILSGLVDGAKRFGTFQAALRDLLSGTDVATVKARHVALDDADRAVIDRHASSLAEQRRRSIAEEFAWTGARQWEANDPASESSWQQHNLS